MEQVYAAERETVENQILDAEIYCDDLRATRDRLREELFVVESDLATAEALVRCSRTRLRFVEFVDGVAAEHWAEVADEVVRHVLKRTAA